MVLRRSCCRCRRRLLLRLGLLTSCRGDLGCLSGLLLLLMMLLLGGSGRMLLRLSLCMLLLESQICLTRRDTEPRIIRIDYSPLPTAVLRLRLRDIDCRHASRRRGYVHRYVLRHTTQVFGFDDAGDMVARLVHTLLRRFMLLLVNIGTWTFLDYSNVVTCSARCSRKRC